MSPSKLALRADGVWYSDIVGIFSECLGKTSPEFSLRYPVLLGEPTVVRGLNAADLACEENQPSSALSPAAEPVSASAFD